MSPDEIDEIDEIKAYRRQVRRQRLRRLLILGAGVLVLGSCSGCWGWVGTQLTRANLELDGYEVESIRQVGLCTWSYQAERSIQTPDGPHRIESIGGQMTFCPSL
ncbi:MAG: hypothetical protein EA397_11710 [Deltaproteobacteria bacterium]|nr:MAG: hypothetical protein EA397_11710 [Deltaproteobacteria bacterium]